MKRNSASRLMNALSQLDSAKSYTQEPRNTARRKMNHGADATVNAYELVSGLQEFYHEFLEDMNSIYPYPNQTETILGGLGSLKSLVYPVNLNEQCRKPDESTVALLKICATSLPDEGEVPASEFEELRDGLNSLRELSGKTKPALRKVLLDLIQIAEEAIARYENRGAAGLNKARKQMLGELAEIWQVHANTPEEAEEKKQVMTAVAEYFRKFDAVYSKAVKYVPLIENVVPPIVAAIGSM